MAIYLYNSDAYDRFVSYIKKDYDYDITEWLLELLNKNDNIKLDSEYINSYYNIEDATENNINQWEGDDVFTELKDDMEGWCQSIRVKVKQLPGVEDAKVKRSDSTGMSTYINVTFKRPQLTDPEVQEHIQEDPKFLTHYFSGFGINGGYEGEYRLKFRISNHPPKYTDANVLVNILGHNYSWIESKVLDLCTKRINQLNNYWKNYLETGRISPKQIRRNQARKEKEVIKIELLKSKHISKSLMESIKETFGKDRLGCMLDDNVFYYLESTHTDLEDIIDQIENHSEFKDYDYITLLTATANCLNKYIIEYTFEDNFFDYKLLFQDMENELSETSSRKKLLV